MPPPASPALQQEHARCCGAGGRRAPGPPTRPAHQASLPLVHGGKGARLGAQPLCTRCSWAGAGLGLHPSPSPSAQRRGSRMVVPGPHLALCTLTLPLSETFLQDMAPDFQAPLYPLPQHTSGNLRGTAAVCQELCRALCTSLTRARLEQRLVTARVWAGTCARVASCVPHRVPETRAVRSPVRTRLCKFRLKCYWLMMLFAPLGFQLSFEGI